MQSDRSAKSSDLDRSRELSRRLASGRAPVGAPASRGGSHPVAGGFVRFSAARIHGFEGPARGNRSPAAHAARNASPEAPAGLQWIDRTGHPTTQFKAVPVLTSEPGWDATLSMVVRAVEAEAAFVIDGQGLLVAGEGPVSPDMLQGIGARMVFALQQADEMRDGADAQTISIEFDRDWLTGVRLRLADGTALAVGLLTARPLGPDARSLVLQAFAPKTRTS